jgi:hypothetical protein
MPPDRVLPGRRHPLPRYGRGRRAGTFTLDVLFPIPRWIKLSVPSPPDSSRIRLIDDRLSRETKLLREPNRNDRRQRKDRPERDLHISGIDYRRHRRFPFRLVVREVRSGEFWTVFVRSIVVIVWTSLLLIGLPGTSSPSLAGTARRTANRVLTSRFAVTGVVSLDHELL